MKSNASKRIKIALVYLLPLLILAACGDQPSKKKENTLNPTETPNPSNHTVSLLNEETIKTTRLVTQVRTGDLLTMLVKGTRKTPLFSPEYVSVATSTWVEKQCPFPGICIAIPRVGSCEMVLRDFLSYEERPIDFTRPEDQRLELHIGDKPLALGAIQKLSDGLYQTEVTIRAEAILETRDLFIMPLGGDPQASTIRIGFQRFGRCDGIGQPEFRTSIPISVGTMSTSFLDDLIVTLTVTY